MFWKKLKSTYWPEIFFLASISSLAYLPQLGNLSYSKLDDWYFVYDALTIGSKVFTDLTLHTRPMRGPLYQLYFSLFGLHPLPYHLMQYFWRYLGGLGALGLFHQLWPRQRQSNFFLAALFLIFPGYVAWVSGLAFQPYVVSLSLQVLSIVFSLKAIGSASVGGKAAWAVSAILTGWSYLGMVEFAIGMEVFRILCVHLFLRRRNHALAPAPLALKTLRASAPFLVVPVGFVTWYVFFFENWRRAQDVGTQLGRLFASPATGFWWLVSLVRSALNVSVFAWGIPFEENFFAGRLKEILLGAACAAIAVLLGLIAYKYLRLPPDPEPALRGGGPLQWPWEACLLGLTGTLAGIFPIVLANRVALFNYSHYTLPASLAGVTLLGGILYSIFPERIRVFALSFLIAIATLTHNAVSARAVNEEQVLSRFWWQMTWRAPSIRPDTLLMVNYPDLEYSDADEFAWGPANVIYYPEKQAGSPVRVPLPSIFWEPDTLTNILVGKREFQTRDLVITDTSANFNFGNLLILNQAEETACVHAIDGRWPVQSIHDSALLMLTSPKSRIDNIDPGTGSAVPPEVIFGSEPPHQWCYYYQKADLALQQGNWQQVARLGDQALQLGFHPNDQIEWMPFLQAFAALDDPQMVKDISTRINTEPFYRLQACQNLHAMSAYGHPMSDAMQATVDSLFCRGK